VSQLHARIFVSGLWSENHSIIKQCSNCLVSRYFREESTYQYVAITVETHNIYQGELHLFKPGAMVFRQNPQVSLTLVTFTLNQRQCWAAVLIEIIVCRFLPDTCRRQQSLPPPPPPPLKRKKKLCTFEVWKSKGISTERLVLCRGEFSHMTVQWSGVVTITLYINHLLESFFAGTQKDKISIFCMFGCLNIEHCNFSSIRLYPFSQLGGRRNLFGIS
jgi:hypothetical protein